MEPSSWISLCSGILGMALNLLLIPVILCYSSQSMQKYKYLMLTLTTSAVLYTASQAIALPTYYLFDGGFVLCSTATFASKELKIVGLFIFCSTFALVEIIVCLSFFFRYGVMCNEHAMRYFEFSKRLIALILLAFICWLIPSFLFAQLRPDNFVISYIQAKSKNRQLYEMTCLGGPLILATGDFYPPMVYALISFVLLTITTITIDVFCIIKIRRVLKKAAESATIRMQKKLLILLYLQKNKASNSSGEALQMQQTPVAPRNQARIKANHPKRIPSRRATWHNQIR